MKKADTCIELQRFELAGSALGPLSADKVLRRGDKLGYDPQRKTAALRAEQVRSFAEEMTIW